MPARVWILLLTIAQIVLGLISALASDSWTLRLVGIAYAVLSLIGGMIAYRSMGATDQRVDQVDALAHKESGTIANLANLQRWSTFNRIPPASE
jgi:membrane protein implicated in regulation of membrane protease activity